MNSILLSPQNVKELQRGYHVLPERTETDRDGPERTETDWNGPKRTFVDTETDFLSTETDFSGYRN